MQHNYQDNWSNKNPGGSNANSPLSYSVVRADGTVISWTLQSPSSEKATPRSRAL